MPRHAAPVLGAPVLLAGPGRQGRVVEHGIQADGEPVDRLAGAREPVELVDRLVDAVPELCHPFLRYPGVPDEGAQLADLVRRGGLLCRDLEVVEVRRKRDAVSVPAETDVEHPRGAAVVALFDRPDAPGPHDAQQADSGQDADVVRDGTLGSLDRAGQLGHGRGALVQQAEDGRAQGVADRPHLLGGGELDCLVEVVVRDWGIARHGWIRLTSTIVRDIWIIEASESEQTMAELVLYHHAQGLTRGVEAFAAELRQAGHTVHVPDLYEGHTFGTLEEGLTYARRTGFGTLMERGVSAAEGLGDTQVYAGFSLGVMPAQRLAQTRAGAKGSAALPLVLPGVGVRRRLAGQRSRPSTRDGRRPVLRRRRRPRRGTRPGWLRRASRTVPLSRQGAPVRRLLAAVVRPGRGQPAHAPGHRLPRPNRMRTGIILVDDALAGPVSALRRGGERKR